MRSLVLGDDGRRLAKRHGDTHLDTYCRSGVPAERIVGLLACWCGAGESRAEMAAADFRDAFDMARLSRGPVTFMEDVHQWMLNRC